MDLEEKATCAISNSPDSSGGPETMKRQNYLEWSEYFMAVAFLSAQRSKDPSSQ
ncbi:deoxycytidylate deaminase, partial [Tachysurus ichikawai]